MISFLPGEPLRATGVVPLRGERVQVSLKYEAPLADMPELLWTDEASPHHAGKDRSARGQRVRMRTVHGLLHNRRPHIDSGCPPALIAVPLRRAHVLS